MDNYLLLAVLALTVAVVSAIVAWYWTALAAALTAPRAWTSRRARLGMSSEGSALHVFAIVAGLIGAIFVVIAVMLYYGYVAPSAVDGVTLAASELYAALAVVAAIFSEIAARHFK